MSALVERIIAARDRLRPLRVQSDDYFRGAIGEAVDTLADAANALDSYEKTMRVIAEGGSAPIDWATVAEEALGVMKAAADVAAKRAADEIYARILDSAQDYLEENLRFNIASTLATAERERKAAQDRVGGLLALIGEQNAALKLAEDVLSRSPFSTQMWPNGMHPNTGIEQIRAAIAKAEASQ